MILRTMHVNFVGPNVESNTFASTNIFYRIVEHSKQQKWNDDIIGRLAVLRYCIRFNVSPNDRCISLPHEICNYPSPTVLYRIDENKVDSFEGLGHPSSKG